MTKKINPETKKNFLFGIMSGIAVIATIGFLTLLLQGQTSTAKTANSNSQVKIASANTNTNAKPQPVAAPTPTAPTKVDVEVTDDDHIRGNIDAPVTIVEFSDYQCPFCSRFHDTMKEVMVNYPDQVRWVYKHFPLDSLHPYARQAAEAAECAGEQDEFWEYSDYLLENQSAINPSFLSQAAVDLGLKASQFDSCLEDGKYTAKVDADYQAGVAAGVRGTPGNFINGISVSGAQPYEQIKQVIDSLL